MKKQLSKVKIKRISSLQKKARTEVNKQWGLYWSMVDHLGKEQALELTHQNISNVWAKYRDKKYPITHKSKFEGLKFEEKSNTFNKKEKRGTTTEFYKVVSEKKIDKTVNKVFNTKNVRYVLITFKIRTKEGLVQYVSDSFTKEAYERVIDNDEDIFETVMNKLSFVQKYDGYELLSTHIRVIYENFKAVTNTKRKKVKKTKK